MPSRRWMLAICLSLAAVVRIGDSAMTRDPQKYSCGTFGSGVVSPFKGVSFYLRTTCTVSLIRFTHNRVECAITVRRGSDGLLVEAEIVINHVRTLLRNGSILVEGKSPSLPYDHTYQYIYQYGIHTRLRSLLLPLTVTWHNVPGGMDSLWVTLDQDLNAEMTGLCVTVQNSKMLTESVQTDGTCQTLDSNSVPNRVCREFRSRAFECLRNNLTHYNMLCEQNIYKLEDNRHVRCSFFTELLRKCDKGSNVRWDWRKITDCDEPSCPGNMTFVEASAPFGPTCSYPQRRAFNREVTDGCVCPDGMVLNDRKEGSHCIPESLCPCSYAGMTFAPGQTRSTKCQWCLCQKGRWNCSDDECPPRCLIEGTYITSYDGKQYAIPGKCAYIASMAEDWSVSIEFFSEGTILKSVVLEIFQDKYTFINNNVLFGTVEVTELHQSAHALVFWQSSTYVQVHTSVGMTMQVQLSPQIQAYITLPVNHSQALSGLCGNSNSDTNDDFTTTSGMVESSAQIFAESWSIGTCGKMLDTCVNTNYEMYAENGCAVLNAHKGIFAKCHDYVMAEPYYKACVQRVCTCTTAITTLQQCLCVALASYAKACANVGVKVGDWRKVTDCDQKCQHNQQFSYDTVACNRTCLSLAGPDPRCEATDPPVDGCGCPDGTHLNPNGLCTSMGGCMCRYQDRYFHPGRLNMNGRDCMCENGKMECSYDCGCKNGTICVDCTHARTATAQKTCESLSKPQSHNMSCVSGCYCPPGQYEDHHGQCVSMDNCTCMYSGSIYSAGGTVKTNCKTCTCDGGHWHCKHQPCSDSCLVFGNGHYRTFDAKWFSFDGHCEYTLVEDDCGTGDGSFSITVESVPCCDENHTCSRNIEIELQGKITLILSDLSVTRHVHKGYDVQDDMHYAVTNVGLYIIISLPQNGITVIWDKSTMVTIELQDKWRKRVCGLCGNFDSNEMNDQQGKGAIDMSSTLDFGNSWKTGMPPCSDVTTETFPCQRNTYCMAWAERRCTILTGDIFKDCHLKVDPVPYYTACVSESCSCQFDGKFQGFCTAVAAYAEACSDKNICIDWRTPDLCPVYCDYYNSHSQSTWNYEPCSEVRTCGIPKQFTRKLEGCFPRCPEDAPYYDENTGKCTELGNCTCYYNNTLIQPGEELMPYCSCENGSVSCHPPTTTTTTQTSATTFASTILSTTEPLTSTVVPTSTTQTMMPTSVASTILNTIEPGATTPTTVTSSATNTSISTTVTWASLNTLEPGATTSTTVPTSTTHTWRSTTIASTTLSTTMPTTTWTTTNPTTECPSVCPQALKATCSQKRKPRLVWDGCCETWVCNCECEVYGDPHYVTFEGVAFTFLEECTYILVEERTPRHHLMIAVDNFDCNGPGSCARGFFLTYQNNTASLRVTQSNKVQATLNNETIQLPYEEYGIRFEPGYEVVLRLPELRSYISLTPFFTLKVVLAMEHFVNNTQGQCGVCGGPSCVRPDGQVESDDCCDKTAHDWLYPDPMKPACVSAPVNVSCHVDATTPPTSCPGGPLCAVLDDEAFDECRQHVDLERIKRNCEFDSCGRPGAGCSSLEFASKLCEEANVCVKWRMLTDGTCDAECPDKLVYKECRDTLDDVCHEGVIVAGMTLIKNMSGCFCPLGQIRSGYQADTCVSNCTYVKTCIYNGTTYEVGARWPGPNPCTTLTCTSEGIQEETKNCTCISCSKEEQVLGEDGCCHTCMPKCAPKLTSLNVTLIRPSFNCTTTIQIPICMGPCAHQMSVMLSGHLQVEQVRRCCQKTSSERRKQMVQCAGATTSHFFYDHITSCECMSCG